MSDVCDYLIHRREPGKCQGQILMIDKFMCYAFLSKGRELTTDEVENYCLNRCEECSYYQKSKKRVEKVDKIGDKIDHMRSFFGRK